VPKLGQEPIRRAALINAAIEEIGSAGTLDVKVAAIARRAGMSSGLAHHYFGSKDRIVLAAMRQILTRMKSRFQSELAAATTPRERLNALIATLFDPTGFEPAIVSAWLTFYIRAQSDAGARRLLRLYTSRLHSNLVYNLKSLTNPANAEAIAHGLGALVDGLYIRQALGENPLDRYQTMGLVWDYLDLKLAQGPMEE